MVSTFVFAAYLWTEYWSNVCGVCVISLWTEGLETPTRCVWITLNVYIFFVVACCGGSW
jgi:hypothetical protein